MKQKWFKFIKFLHFFGTKIIILLGFIFFLISVINLNNNSNNFATLNSKKYQQKDTTDITKNQLTDFSFPDLLTINDNKLGSYNVRNIYNISNHSLLYASLISKSTIKTVKTDLATKTESKISIDALVYLNQENNKITWSYNTTSLISTLKTYRSTTSKKDVSVDNLKLNKTIFAPKSNAFYTLAYAKTNFDTASKSNATVIFKIEANSGNVSVYFDSLVDKNNMILTGGGDYKNFEFDQMVLQLDLINPTLLIFNTKFSSDELSKIFIGFSVFQTGISSSGLFSANLDSSDLEFIKTKTNKIYVTNSIWLNNALILITQNQNETSISSSAKAYSFSLNGGTFNAPSVINIPVLEDKTNQTFFDVFNDDSGTYLIGKSGIEKENKFLNQGTLLMHKLHIVLDQNNAILTIETIKNQIPYFDKATPIGIISAIKDQLLDNQISYLSLSSNHVLVGLNNKFEYVKQISFVNTVESEIKILNIINNGLYYLLYLSNGSIMAYSNSGFVGYVSNLTTYLPIERTAPISFIPQTNIINGAKFFTQTASEFENNYKTEFNKFLNYASPYSLDSNITPKYEFKFETQEIKNKSYNQIIKVNVYQNLYQVNKTELNKINLTTTVVGQVFLGSYLYYLFNNSSNSIQIKTKDQLKLNLQYNLPSTIASFYNQPNNQIKAINDFLIIKNIDIMDQTADNKLNVSLIFIPDDTKGSLTVNVKINYMRDSLKQITNQTRSAVINNLAIGPSATDLNYQINPISAVDLLNKYKDQSPKDLNDSDILTNFISLSPFLNSLSPTISIIPNEVAGNAIITLTFKFPNENYYFKPIENENLIKATQNAITWKTFNVFKTQPNLNASIYFQFNTITTIQEANPSIVLQQPSTIFTLLNNSKTINEKISLVADTWKLINASNPVRNLISNIQITNAFDLTGSFNLEITFNQPLVNTNQTKYTHTYSGFATVTKTIADVFSVTFIDKAEYLNKYNPSSNQNLFNLVPSSVSQSDLIVRIGSSLSPNNNIAGGVIKFSENSFQVTPKINLVANDPNGELLVSIFFSEYIELVNNQPTLVYNKKIVHIFSGFATNSSNTNQGNYFLNWKPFNQLKIPASINTNQNNLIDANKTNASVLKPANEFSANDFANQLKLLSSIQAIQVLATLSKTVFDKYSNSSNIQLLKLSFTPNDEMGTLSVNAEFSDWNAIAGVSRFHQIFSGFLVSAKNILATVNSFDPFNKDALNDLKLNELKSEMLVSDVDAKFLANYFSFSNNALNNHEKKIFFLYNKELGVGRIYFYVRLKQNQILTNFLQTNIFKLVDTVNKSNFNFNLSVIPDNELRQEGYMPLKATGQLISGFKKFEQKSSRTSSIINLSLAIGIPIVVFIPLIALMIYFKNISLVWLVKRRINYVLDLKIQNTQKNKKTKK